MKHLCGPTRLSWPLILSVSLVWCLPAQAGEPVKVSQAAGGMVTMENETIRMVVDPTHGGSVISFVHKPLGRDVVPPNRAGDQMGLMLDHYWEDGWPWPGEMMTAKYKVADVKTVGGEGVLRMRCALKGTYAGKSDPKVKGLVFEKTITLRSGIDAVFCRAAFSNPTQETKVVAYWLQNYYHVGGDYDEKEDVFARPTTTGIFRAGRVAATREFIWDATRGWTAATDTGKGHGLVCLMDYNYLNSLYNYANNVTQEWVYDKALIPPGKTWGTDIVVLPFSNVRDISFASPHLIAGLHISRAKDGKILLTHSLRQGIRPAGDVNLSVEVMSGSSDKRRTFALKPGSLGQSVKALKQEIADDIPDPLIVKVRATGQSGGQLFEEDYWDWYTGTYGYGRNVQVDMITPVYQEKRPRKRPVLLKPDVIRRIRGKRLYYAMMGLYSEHYRLDEAFRLAGQEPAPDGMPTVGEYTLNTYGMGPQISEFPFDYDKLMRYEAIVIANVHVDCLGPLGKPMLHDYVTHGGGLLVLGGMAAYSSSGWKKSPLQELLPVELADTLFDLERLHEGTLRVGEPHPITKAVRQTPAPRADYINRVNAVKKGAKVLLYAGDRPFLVVWQTGKGRVACLLGTPYGAAEGQYFKWDEWPMLMKNVLHWLGAEKGG